MSIYVATSWRNKEQPGVVQSLRNAGHRVYDFRTRSYKEGAPESGFHWSWIDEKWKQWSPRVFRMGLVHPIAKGGFNHDFEAMMEADTCVLVLPCGRSAHIVAGWFVGQSKDLIILLADGEPELMYRLTDYVAVDIEEVLSILG